MQSETAAIVGFGDLGMRLCRGLAPTRWRCVALKRHPQQLPANVRGVSADVTDAASLRVLAELHPALLVITLTPGARDETAYRRAFSEAMGNIIEGLRGHQPRRAFFVSSTRVYAEADGGWIDESSPLATEEGQAAAIIEAEQSFLAALSEGIVLRAGGLYGSGPGRMLKRVAAGKHRAREPLRYGNRIHREDVAGFMLHLLEHGSSERIFNLVDDAPVSLQEVEEWICARLNRPWEPATMPDGTSSKHRRIRNRRLHASGYRLRYPSYRDGYCDVLRRWTEHSKREDGLDLH